MVEDIVANYLRVTSCLEIERANSGHPGVCLGAAPIFEAIYKKAFFCVDKPNFISRDRIVFSAGHASALIYATLNLFGFNISNQDLLSFRKLGSITTGHPEVYVAPGIDVSTGPLGQGVANAVGFAIAEEFLRNKYKRENLSPIDNYTYCFCGDGCLMEGVALEAVSLAGNLGLNKLILIYDKNDVTIEGKLDLANSEDVKAKFLACNWNVIEVTNGNNISDIEDAIDKAKNSTKPNIIIVKTHIGFGSELENSNKVHGKPLNREQIVKLRQNLKYFVPDWEKPKEAESLVKMVLKKNKDIENRYYATLKKYKEKYPKEFDEFLTLTQKFSFNFEQFISDNSEAKFNAREEFHKLLNIIGDNIPNLIGGSADLGPSTKAYFDNEDYFSKTNKKAKNIAFGIREHSMGAICNGIGLYGPLRAFCSTFFAFENYMTPPIRMSALMNVPVLYLFSHDCFNIGEDGPTHQSVEQIATLRAMPNIYVCRPAGWNEMLACFKGYFDGEKPYAMLISKQEVSAVNDNYYGALKGGYIIEDNKNFDATLIATGSDVSTAISASNLLKEKKIKIRVVSMPCVEVFEKQSDEYKKSVVDKSKPVFCFEASGDNVWYRYATGDETIFNIRKFGKSGSAKELTDYFEFNASDIALKIEKFLKK